MKTGLRILSLLLALALLPAIAMAEPTAQNILSDDPFNSLAAVGDELYALSYGALYHVDVGTGQLQKLTPDQKDLPADAALPAMDRLFADAQGLLAFDSGSSTLYRIDVHQQPLTALAEQR